MLRLLETPQEFNTFKNEIKHDGVLILVPVFVDLRLHPVVNMPCLVVIHRPEVVETIGIPLNHPDCANVTDDPFDLGVSCPVWVPNKKDIIHLAGDLDLYDATALEYIGGGDMDTDSYPFDTFATTRRYRRFHAHRNLNLTVPIYKLLEAANKQAIFLSSIIKQMSESIETDQFRFLNQIALPALQSIEIAGLAVDVEKLNKHLKLKSPRLLVDNKVYSQYNLYTKAGRPSCRFGGINFVALNKSDGSRAAFVSRFTDGVLVQFDFEAYHIRLIANLLNYKFPPDISVHEYFGKQYFADEIENDQLTKEQYAESKQQTFTLLYSDAESDISFFQEVATLKQDIWKKFQRDGYIESPLTRKQIQMKSMWEPSPSKVFNYLVQFMETEQNLITLSKLSDIYKEKQSRIILYTYDSILIDFSLGDGRNLLAATVMLLEFGGKYPVRAEYGSTFHEMRPFEIN